MSEQQLTGKQQLVVLVQSLVAAHTSGDELLKQFANNNFSQFISKYDLVELPAEPAPPENPSKKAKT